MAVTNWNEAAPDDSGNGGYNPYIGAAGMAGMGLGQMMGNYKNPADSANNYIDQGQNQLNGYMDYYTQGGHNAGGRVNEIGQNYHQSPGYQFALQQALQGSNHAAAAGGYSGSPQHEQQNMTLASNIANQDYNQWMQNALGIYGIGAKSGQAQGEDNATLMLNKAKLNYEGQNAENQHKGGMWGTLLGGAGAAAGAYFGGPAGASVGWNVGKSIGGG